jgi:RNA polymerase sigma-70 factor (ECF subfamily)
MGLTDVAEPTSDDADFAAFADAVTAPLLRALVAAFGPEVGREAALDALAWGWEHWERLRRMRNPPGYLYRVGQTNARRALRRTERFARPPASRHEPQVDTLPDVALEHALAQLSPRQRAAALLVAGHGMTHREAAGLLGCSESTLRNHLERALRHLRTELEDDDAG